MVTRPLRFKPEKEDVAADNFCWRAATLWRLGTTATSRSCHTPNRREFEVDHSSRTQSIFDTDTWQSHPSREQVFRSSSCFK